MSQLLLFFALQLMGTWVSLAVGPRREPWLAMAMGLLIGLAIAVFGSLPLLLCGWFGAGSVVAVIALAFAASVGVALWRHRVTARVAVFTVAWAVAFTAACIPFCVWDLSMKTYDSQIFIDYAVAFQEDGRLSLETLTYLNAWGSFQIIAHALAVVTDENFLYALSPAFSISLFATFAVTLDRGLSVLGVARRSRVVAIVLALIALLAIPLVRVHVVYIHANWAATGYLFVFAALCWLAELTEEAGYLSAAFLGLLAFSFARVESPMFTAVFLVLVLSQTRLARSAVLVAYLPFTLVLTAWLALMAAVVPADTVYLTPSKALLMAVAIAGICGAYIVRDSAQRWLPRVPLAVAALCVIGVAVMVVLRFDTFELSFSIWQKDLWLGRFWGYFLWPTLVVLAVMSRRVPQPPHTLALRYSIVLFFVLVTLLTTLGDAYGTGRYSSLTRVTLHVVPLLVFYFAIVFVPAWSRRDAESREPVR